MNTEGGNCLQRESSGVRGKSLAPDPFCFAGQDKLWALTCDINLTIAEKTWQEVARCAEKALQRHL